MGYFARWLTTVFANSNLFGSYHGITIRQFHWMMNGYEIIFSPCQDVEEHVSHRKAC